MDTKLTLKLNQEVIFEQYKIGNFSLTTTSHYFYE